MTQHISVENAFISNTANPIEKSDFQSLREKLNDIQKAFKQEAGNYEALIKDLRAWTKSHEQKDHIDAALKVAEDIRNNFKAEAFVTIGIGGSDLGGRTIDSVLNHSFHNLLSREERGNAPRLFFTGDTFDPKELHDLLDYLETSDLLTKTIFNVISKSGTTSETIGAFLILKERLEKALEKRGVPKEDYAKQVVATTGLNEKSALFVLNQKQSVPFRALLPVPDGVGGRFSFASPVGLLFLAVSANENIESPRARMESAIKGLEDAEASAYLSVDSKENVAFNLAAINFLAEQKGRTSVVFYPYSKTLKFLGDWYTQLNTESLQEKGQGQNVIATTGPTGNHSIANGIVGGPRDKIVTFIRVEEYDKKMDFSIPKNSGIGGELEVLEGLKLGYIQNASQKGTEINFTDNGVVNIVISIPKINAYELFKLMYTLEVSVAVEGELRGLGELTYLQPGVEGYKKETRRLLAKT